MPDAPMTFTVADLPPLRSKPPSLASGAIASWAADEAPIRAWDRKRATAIGSLAHSWARSTATQLIGVQDVDALITTCVQAVLKQLPARFVPGWLFGMVVYQLAWLVVSVIIRYLLSSEEVRGAWGRYASTPDTRQDDNAWRNPSEIY